MTVQNVSSTNGLYYWAGPGTIRMIKLKYPSATINTASFLHAYDLPVITQARDVLGITDAWVSYSWGFAPDTERTDYAFTREKLANFRRLGITTHGYIQGCNLVLSEHRQDYYCRDYLGRLIPYHRGRRVTCPNNPQFRGYIERKITQALTEDFDGIFVDNVHFGQFPLPVSDNWFTFFGCACRFCKKLFKQQFGSEIPRVFQRASAAFEDYMEFRRHTMATFLKFMSRLVKSSGKVFGTNSFDPKFDSLLYYGVDLSAAEKLQDYVLVENHSAPGFTNARNNQYLKPLIKKVVEQKKPLFVVSYHKGIGREPSFTQSIFDAIYSESREMGYMPCYKGTEYTTDKIWHNYDFFKLNKPKKVMLTTTSKPMKPQQLQGRLLLPVYNRLYNPLLTAQFENRFVRKSFSWLMYRVIA